MKKILTILALLAVALNFSSASLWSQEIQKEVFAPVVVDEVKDDEAKLAETALTADESLENADETKTEVVAAVTPVVTPATEEKKEENTDASVVEPVPDEAKVA